MAPRVSPSGFGRQSAFICRSCLSPQQPAAFQWRPFSVTAGLSSPSDHVVPAIRHPDIGAPPTEPPPSAGIARLKSRRLISVTGSDAAKHLHGLMTRNVQDGMPHHGGFYGAFLSAKGRVLHDVFLYPHNTFGAGLENPKPEQSFLIDVDANEAMVLWRHLKRYRLRQKVWIRLLEPNEATVWQAWADPEAVESAAGPGRNPKMTVEEKLLRSVETAVEEGVHVIRDTRAPGMGFRLVTVGSKTPPPPMFRLPSIHQSAYRLRRYLRGVPEGQGEILYDQALPFESNMDLMGGIDFRKGCYIGQELTIRTKHRGVVRKRTLPCVLYNPVDNAPETLGYSPAVRVAVPSSGEMEDYDIGNVPPNTSISRDGKSGRAAGKWMHGVGNLGLGVCRLEVMTDLAVPGMPDVAAGNPEETFIIQPEPEAAEKDAADKAIEDSEGTIEAGKGAGPRMAKGAYWHPYIGPKLKIKAFVPDWIRRGLVSEAPKH